MIIKPILNGVAKHLENVYGIDTFTQSGLRLTYVVCEAYITSDEPIRLSGELLKKAHTRIDDFSNYEAFERSVYRELKNITNGKRNANIVKTIYGIAEGIKL